MTFTHEEILEAVRIAGRDGQAFGCAAVREELKVSTRNRRELSKFHRRFKTFQDAAPDEIVRVGNNLYRLTSALPRPAHEDASVNVSEPVNVHAPESPAPEPAPVPQAAPESSLRTSMFGALSQGELSDAIDFGIDEALKTEQAPVVVRATIAPEQTHTKTEAAAFSPAISVPAPSIEESAAFLAARAIIDEVSTSTMLLDVDREGVVLAPQNGADILGFVEFSEPMSEADAAAEEAAFAALQAPLAHAADTTRIEPLRSFADVHIAPSRKSVSARASSSSAARARVASSLEQAQILLSRSWRERGQWLGRRVAELFHRA